MAPSIGTRGPFDDGEFGIADGGRKLGGVLHSSVMEGARARAELVFKVGGGDGDAALNFSDAMREVLGKVERAIEKKLLPVAMVVVMACALRLAAMMASMDSKDSSAARRRGENSARLVTGGTNGGFVFGEDGSGH